MAKKVATMDTQNDAIEQGVVAFAEQLGTLVGTVQAKTQGWDRESLNKELTRIRDGAAQLIGQLNSQVQKGRKAASKTQRAKPTTPPSRGLVDAPGKRHRRPPPQEKVSKHASDPKTRVIGNPGLKTGRRGKRG
jgi:hypothetical protein